MSKVVSMRLGNDQQARLERAARRLGRSPAATAALLLEQRLREQEFPGIAIRDTVLGPEAFVEGTRWRVWMVVGWLRDLGGDAEEMARRFDGISPDGIRVAVRYAEAFPDEIEAAIADNRRPVDDLQHDLPGLTSLRARAPAP